MVFKIVRQVHEVFDLFEKTKDRQAKIKVLRENESGAIRDVCRGIFDKSISWNLPEGVPPYTENNPDSSPNTLLKLHMRFKFFVKGLKESESMEKFRREKMFIDILESVHPEDAKILVSMINKKSPVKGLTKKIIQEAYPNLIRE